MIIPEYSQSNPVQIDHENPQHKADKTGRGKGAAKSEPNWIQTKSGYKARSLYDRNVNRESQSKEDSDGTYLCGLVCSL